MNYYPPDFKDRSKWQRFLIDLQVLFRRHAIKAVCCEAFRKGEKNFLCCKGCALIYNPKNPSLWYRMLYRVAKKRV
jgi:hypothetical protein